MLTLLPQDFMRENSKVVCNIIIFASHILKIYKKMLEEKKAALSISCLPLISAESDPAQHLSCALQQLQG